MSDPLEGDDEFVDVGRGGARSAKKRIDDLAPAEADEGETDTDKILAYAPQNDLGNSKRLITRFGDDMMFVENVGWFVWDAARWNHEDGNGDAMKLAHQVAAAITKEAKALKDDPGRSSPERIARLFGWAIQSGNQSKAASMLATAAPYLKKPIDHLDANAFLIAAPNGTIVLKSNCEMRPSHRSDLITRSLGVKFRAGASCPLFEKFLARIMPETDMRGFLQRICGYCLTGSTREHKLFIFYGTGRNGKSTLINALRKVMGDYASSTPVATFMANPYGKDGGEASPDLARLPGARMVTAAEPQEGARLDESKVKEMTGGDPMTVRHLNQGFFEFRPGFKAIISTNHQPTIRGTDHGIWSRINLVPFTVQIPDDEIDRDLETKLLAEAEGILQWMITGAEEWFANGLNPPAKAIAAVEAYRADQDPVGEFLKARCELHPPDYIDPATGRSWEVGQKRLREVYQEWCKDEGLEPMTTRTFGAKLTGRGIQRRKSNGLTFYPCLTIKGELPREGAPP